MYIKRPPNPPTVSKHQQTPVHVGTEVNVYTYTRLRGFFILFYKLIILYCVFWFCIWLYVSVYAMEFFLGGF